MRRYALLLCVTLADCDMMGTAKVNLTSADALQRLAVENEQVLNEYHNEVREKDAAKRAAAVADLIIQVTDANGDKAKQKAVADKFARALSMLDDDADVERDRFSKAKDNCSLMREMGAKLTQFGIDSMSLQDEYKRYFGSLSEQIQKSREASAQQRATKQAEKSAARTAAGAALGNAILQATGGVK